MLKQGFAAFSVLALFAGIGFAQPEKKAGDVVADVARTLGAANLNSVQYSGTGFIFSFGQSYRPGGPWPKFRLQSYTRMLDYEKGASREDAVWTGFEKPPLGGGFQPIVGSLHVIESLNGDYAWTFGGPGPANPDPQGNPTPGAVEERQRQMALTPYGWVKAALAANPTLEPKTLDGKPVSMISFPWKGAYKINGYVDNKNLLVKTETWTNSDILGDMPVETSYADYRKFSGQLYPGKILQKQGGFPVLDLTVTSVQPNAPINIEVPDTVRRAVPPPPRVTSQKMAEGVWAIQAGGAQSAAIEFNDYSVVVEAYGGEARSLLVIGETKRLIPNKPIRYLVNTHHHLDHSGGLRAYVAEGATIITHEMNKPFFEQILPQPHTVKPDQLSRNPRPAVFLTVKDKYVLTDGARTMELHLVQGDGNTHNPGLLVAYLPKEKVLVEADSYSVNHERPGARTLVGLNRNLLDNLQRLNLSVEQIVPVHGQKVMTFAEFRKAVETNP
jgi:glyoxylase-like metal-dependent hydrolase (beta-lactamase superfamily II)